MTRLWIAALLLLLLAGCQQGTVRNDPMALEPETGGFSQSTSNTGAGDIYVKLAIAYLNEGQIEVALRKAQKAQQVEPGNPDADNVLGIIYERLGQYDLAERHFRQGVARQPSNSYLHNAYGSFLCNRGRFDEALKQFQLAVGNPLYNTPEVALANAGICAARKSDLKLAEQYLRQALQRNPRFPIALRQMAKVSYERGEYLSARAYLQRYLEVGRHTPATLWLGIQTERKLGDQDALASYSLLLRNNFPDSREAQLLRETRQQ